MGFSDARVKTMPNRVLITGSNKGIGLSLTLAFAHAGWDVIATARKSFRPTLKNAATRFPNIQVVELDVTDEPSIALAAESVTATHPALDVLVNNAAIFPGEGTETLETLDINWFAEAFETNVTGVACVTRAFLPLLRNATHPRIVNISSGAGSISEKDDASYYPYSVSKAALNMLTRIMAQEFMPEGISVTSISPGWVRTDMGGSNAELTPDESAAALFHTICQLTLGHSGKFLDRNGSDSIYGW